MDRHRPSHRNLIVLYGSQTGTAEEVANMVAREGIRRHFEAEVSSLDSFNVNKLQTDRTVVFVCSTTGQGDPPENMKRFWKFIMLKNLPETALQNLKFSIIGLGDSSYLKYNFVAKKLHRRLCQLSAAPLLPPILADDQHDCGYDAALDAGLPNLWNKVLQIMPLPANRSIIPNTEILPSRFRITTSPVSTNLAKPEAADFPAIMTRNDRLTAADHFQDVRLIALDITDSDLRYEPGDVVYIRPSNLPDIVKEFLKLLRLNAEEPFYLRSSNSDAVLPPRLQGALTWRQLATSYLDLNACPRRYFYELLSHFSRDELETEKLREFCSAEGQDERFAYADRVKRTPLEVLSDFVQTTPYIPHSYIFDLFPPLQPRAFSIASAQQASPGSIEILMAVVRYKTKLQTPRIGVCSTWLASLDPGSKTVIPVRVQKGTLKFPRNYDSCVMIGPGTGVAPFRSLMQQRAAENSTEASPRNLLYFGCRNKAADFLCEAEWLTMVEMGTLQLRTAFSRDQDEKYYVWNSIQDSSKLLWNHINADGSYIFVAGNSKRMPDDVRATIVKVAAEEGEMTEKGAEEYIAQLERTGRYQLECWS